MEMSDAIVAAVAVAFLFGGIAAVLISIMKVAQTKLASDGKVESTLMLRNLAEEATAAQRSAASELTEIRLALADVKERLVSVERMMADVG